jgi:hypothetical protein
VSNLFHGILLPKCGAGILGLRFSPGKRQVGKSVLHYCNGGGMPDWDDLRIFLAVARSESLSAAGRGL